MPLTRWLMGIGLVVALGCLQVAQRNAMFLQGYAVGNRMTRLHADETQLSWLRARVTQLSSPAMLARAAQERQTKFVAWSTLPAHPTFRDLPQPTLARAKARAGDSARPLVHVAAVDPDAPAADDGTSD